jgi:MoaA/NifB/PqqE/SkfB family radical SAM enzyme
MKYSKDELHQSKSFCLLPFVHSCIWHNGNVRPCCVADGNIFGNVKDQSLDEIYSNNNQILREFRKEMINGKLPDACFRCKDQEDHGGISYRTGTSMKHDHLIDEIEFDSEGNLTENKIYMWDVRLSNLCNLTCRICSPKDSSKIALEHQKLGFYKGPVIIAPFFDFDEFANFFKKHVDYITEFYFAGGEPLIIEDHYKILDLIVKSGKAGQVQLRYNLNCTHLGIKDYNVIDLWKQFSFVHLGCSIDGPSNTLSYIRHGASWDIILNNLRIIQEQILNCRLTLFPTVQILNIFDIYQMHREFHDAGIRFTSVHFNVLTEPNYFRLSIMTSDFKDKVIPIWNEYSEWLKTNTYHIVDIKRIDYVLSMLQSKDESIFLPELKNKLSFFDKSRGEDYKKTFPWIDSMIESYLNKLTK